jgi:hypothetical protein
LCWRFTADAAFFDDFGFDWRESASEIFAQNSGSSREILTSPTFVEEKVA